MDERRAPKWGPYCTSCGHPSSYHGASFCQVDAGSTRKKPCDCDGYSPAGLPRLPQRRMGVLRDMLVDAIQDQTGWDWEAEGQVPSGRDECGDLADAVLEALGTAVPDGGAYSTGLGWLLVDGRRHAELCELEVDPAPLRPPDPPPAPPGQKHA